MTYWEVVQIDVKAGHEDAFEDAFRAGRGILRNTEGCYAARLHRAVDAPGWFLLMIEWESVGHHTDRYVGSEPAREMSALLTPHLAQAPTVHHTSLTDAGFERSA